MKYAILLLILLFAITFPDAFADNPKAGEQINWQVLSNGGTLSASTNYILQGTISQTAVGEATSSNYKLTHGFWHTFTSQELPCDGRCGDANYDGSVNISDAVYIINYVFLGGGPPEPRLACGDTNQDAGLNISDAVYLLLYIFSGGGAPSDCHPDFWEEDCCPY